MTRGVRFGVAVAASVVLLLAGCAPVPNVAVPSYAPSPSNTSVPVASDDFYGQTVKWSSCNGGGYDCATVKAPIDWDSTADGAISLAVIRHKADGNSMGSLLVNPGGPGGSGYDFVANSLDFAVSSNLSENYDIVGWDPRGVGKSTPVTCYTDPKQIDELLYGTYDDAYGSQGWSDALTANEIDYAAACEKNTGELLGHIDSVSTARDMDLIRALLGDTTLNYLGYSYGTFLGTVYAQLFPQNVGKMVLDGALDPTISSLDELKVQMAGFDSAFKAYMAYCLANDGCPFTGSVDNGLTQAQSMLASVDALHLANDDGRVLDSATLGTAIAEDLYSQQYWDYLTETLSTLQNGDPYYAFLDADSYNSRNQDGTYSGNGTDVYTAANCLDGDFATDPHTTLEGLAEIDAAAPILGKYLAFDDYSALNAACDNWPVPPAKFPATYSADGAPPILVISTTNDPATPYAWGVSLASQLSSGVLVTHTGEGHTAYNKGNGCVDSTVDSYFVDGTVPGTDPMC